MLGAPSFDNSKLKDARRWRRPLRVPSRPRTRSTLGEDSLPIKWSLGEHPCFQISWRRIALEIWFWGSHWGLKVKFSEVQKWELQQRFCWWDRIAKTSWSGRSEDDLEAPWKISKKVRVFFYILQPTAKRFRREVGTWRENSERYYINGRGRCLLIVASNLRAYSEIEWNDF